MFVCVLFKEALIADGEVSPAGNRRRDTLPDAAAIALIASAGTFMLV